MQHLFVSPLVCCAFAESPCLSSPSISCQTAASTETEFRVSSCTFARIATVWTETTFVGDKQSSGYRGRSPTPGARTEFPSKGIRRKTIIAVLGRSRKPASLWAARPMPIRASGNMAMIPRTTLERKNSGGADCRTSMEADGSSQQGARDMRNVHTPARTAGTRSRQQSCE